MTDLYKDGDVQLAKLHALEPVQKAVELIFTINNK